MHQLYQESMAIVRHFGKPSFFVTVTCNPKWPEIQAELLPGQNASDRPDIVARVYNMKLKLILEDLIKQECFGEVLAHVYTIEFQKRGLPHAHILIIMKESATPQTTDDYDRFVCAELPNLITQKELYQTITNCMLHGPCGVVNPNAPCMVDNQCSKNYPKEFLNETTYGNDSFPLYRRRNNGRVYRKTPNSFQYDNRHVIPYNPYLSTMYNCHINVEICSSIKSVKYLYKYICKGPDMAIITLEENPERDETREYVDGRYISAPEAFWRLFSFHTSGRSHAVESLHVHLPGQHMVYYDQESILEDVVAQQNSSKLTQFFNFCRDGGIRDLLYSQIVEVAVWKDKAWKVRKRRSKIIGRLYNCSIRDGEKYFLRILLLHVKGPTSFEDVRSVRNDDGHVIVYPTFKEACIARGLLENDDEWFKCMDEASLFRFPKQLRSLFCFILVFCQPVRVSEMWEKYRDILSEDFLHSFPDSSADYCYNKTLIEIYSILSQHGISLIFGLPPALQDNPETHLERLLREETYDSNQLNETLDKISLLNAEQKLIFETIIESVEGNSNGLFFVDGPGGTGKTFLYIIILNH
jgi:hypothetical protein